MLGKPPRLQEFIFVTAFQHDNKIDEVDITKGASHSFVSHGDEATSIFTSASALNVGEWLKTFPQSFEANGALFEG